MNLTNKNNILEVFTESGIVEKIYVLKYFKINSINKNFIIYKKINNNLIFSAEVIDEETEYKLEKIHDKEVLKIIQKHMEGLVL